MIAPGQHVKSFSQIVFPTTKPEIEKLVLDAALGTNCRLREHYGLVGKPKQTREQDFDFTLLTADGETYLDLMEVAPLSQTGGSHANGPRSYMAGERADAIWDALAQKSNRYGRPPASGIHLMIYSTDFRFRVGGAVGDILVHRAHHWDHCFRNIVYAHPLTATTAMVKYLFLLPEETRQKLATEIELRRVGAIIFHPTEIVILPTARGREGGWRHVTRNNPEPETGNKS
jgi:hypothetical protein